MNTTNWPQVRRIFEAVVDSPPHRRERLLDRACRGDAELRRQVCELLATQSPHEDWLASPVPHAAANLLEMSQLLSQAGRIGSYQITEVIAIGGMGVVLRGIDASVTPARQVAIKILPREYCTRRMLRAFRREQRLLEQLDHPNITRIIDAGLNPDGQPFIVMEYVAGRPIDQYCAAQAISLRERLELFRSVCLAVHFAHQNLIVHRDLKPGNILVTDDGTVKLLDFGIAKLLEDNSPTGGAHTETMTHAMTLQYSSPEQIRGQQITTATDVYSLGVLLYGLLAGRPPYDLTGLSRYEAEKTICESTSPTPRESSTTSRIEWTPALDRLVMMAMHKDPARRYGSAEQLAEDIRRYLDGSPVLAYTPSRFERTIALIRAHRAAFSLAAASFAIVSALAVSLAFTAHSATVARDREMRAREVSQRMNGFMNQLLATANPDQLEMSDAGFHVLDEASVLVGKELADQPEMAASMYMQIAENYYHLRRDPQAIRNYRSALACLRRCKPRDPVRLAECLASLGEALSYHDDKEGLALQREALAIRRSLYGDHHLRVAESMHALGFALTRCVHPPRYAEAEQLYRAALAMRQQLGAADSPATAENIHALAAIMRHQNRLDESAKLYEQALALNRRLPAPTDGRLFDCINDYAACLRDLGRLDDADNLLTESVTLTTEALGEVMASATLSNLAALKSERGDRAGAWQLINRAMSQLSRAVIADRLGSKADRWRKLIRDLDEQSPSPKIESYREFIALSPSNFLSAHLPPTIYCTVLDHLSDIAVHVGQYELAEQVSREAIHTLETHDPQSTSLRIGLQQTLADALAGLNTPDAARSLLTQIHDTLRDTRGPNHRETQAVAAKLANLTSAASPRK